MMIDNFERVKSSMARVIAKNSEAPCERDNRAHKPQNIFEEMLAALEAWEHWYNVDSTEFNRDNAREDGRKAIKKARLLLNAAKLRAKNLETLEQMSEMLARKADGQ